MVVRATNFPRDVNLTRIKTQWRNSLRLARTARFTHRMNPSKSTDNRRRRTTLNAWVMSRKLQYATAFQDATLIGQKRIFQLRRFAKQYYNAKVISTGYHLE